MTRGTRDSPVMAPVVALHDQLVRPRDELQPIGVVKPEASAEPIRWHPPLVLEGGGSRKRTTHIWIINNYGCVF